MTAKIARIKLHYGSTKSFHFANWVGNKNLKPPRSKNDIEEVLSVDKKHANNSKYKTDGVCEKRKGRKLTNKRRKEGNDQPLVS